MLAAVLAVVVLGAGVVAEGEVRPLKAVVTIPPLRSLVEPMLPAGSTIEVLVPPGVSEHGYEIPPASLAELASADVVVMVGLGLEPKVERFLERRQRPSRKVVVFADAAGIASAKDAKAGADVDHAGHVHTEDGSCCDHGSVVDPHVWLDPVLVEKLVPAVASAVRSHLGDDQAALDALAAAERSTLARVAAVNVAYEATLASRARSTVIVGHDAWRRLASRYGFQTVAIAGLTATEPTPASLERAIEAAKEHSVPVIFLEPQLSRAGGERIARTTGLPVRMLDPLGGGDWFATMRANLTELAGALGATPRGEPTAASAGERPTEKP